MKRHLYLIVLIMGMPLLSHAQTLRGTILNVKKQPIEGAQIFLPSVGTHAHADPNGHFVLSEVKNGDTIQVTHIGFKMVRLPVKDVHQEMTITLEEQSIALDEILVTPKLDAINVLTSIDLETNPVNSSQEILRTVPGIVIGQHAGGGKAEQIFLRGFDIDHGTDINISVDGMPVNMVSHAHGQGYSDLHFLIPETIDQLDFGKGPYYSQYGDFTTTGYVAFQTKEKLDQSMVKLEVGQFNTQRMLGMFDVLNTEHHNVYLAAEYLATDGAFDSPQNFNRKNLMAKYTGRISGNDKLSLSASWFSSSWDASGQVPQRAIDSGMISRFGSIDDTEGGHTGRANLIMNYTRNINSTSQLKSKVYLSKYDFELYSNFTFFLEDPENGDQIRQKEDRTLMGMESVYNKSFHWGAMDGVWQIGAGLRSDATDDSELSHTKNRITTLDTLKLGDIDETNLYGFTDLNLVFGKWTINPGLRVDQFKFNYYDELQETYETLSESKATVSPKLNILYNPGQSLQLYVKSGKGFHSNDTRVVVAEEGHEILPAAWGTDVGLIWKPMPRLFINAAWWYLYLEQEFVYVGDAGIVEPSGKTKRLGIDFSFRYQPVEWLFWNTDVNYAYARAIDEAEGEDYIPLAPDLTIMSGINVIHPSGVFGGIHLRYVKDRPANEDNSIVAEGYAVTDLNLGYRINDLEFGIDIQNLFDVDWDETQFATESRLQNEAEPVEEIHFTPGTPFCFKGSITYHF